jgi:ribosomal protein S18 acetylase RimI-like enzyme
MFGDFAKPVSFAIRPPPPYLLIRWATKRDDDAILAINDRAEHPTPAVALARSLCNPFVHTRVGERVGRVVGYIQYLVRDDRVELVGLAVDADRRRSGIGRALAADAKLVLRRSERPLLAFVVPETNLGGLKFWRACGVRATGVARDRFGPGVDGIAFEYTADAALAEQNCPGGVNDVP